MADEKQGENGEFTVIELTDVLDLHSVPARDVKGIVEAYLEEAYSRGWIALRIIHGRGIGVQREVVRGVLGRTSFVVDFGDAPAEAGGWGATLLTLKAGPQVEVTAAAAAEEAAIANLLELYAHDFSEFLALEVGPDGRFGYPPLSSYWLEAGRHPFLVRVEGRLAGFILVKREAAAWDMAEFFVLRRYRKRGVGVRAAHLIWSRFPGVWEVRVLEANPAVKFWERAIARFVGKSLTSISREVKGRRWRTFSFEAS